MSIRERPKTQRLRKKYAAIKVRLNRMDRKKLKPGDLVVIEKLKKSYPSFSMTGGEMRRVNVRLVQGIRCMEQLLHIRKKRW